MDSNSRPEETLAGGEGVKIEPKKNFDFCRRVVRTLFCGGFSIDEICLVFETKNRDLIEQMLRMEIA